MKPLRSWRALFLVACSLALLVLVLSRVYAASPPLLVYLAALTLFLAPGVVLASSLLKGSLSGIALVPVAFALSTGVFGLLGIPALILHWRPVTYLWICAAVIAVSMGMVLLRVLRPVVSTGDEISPDLSVALLWVPFLLVATGLAYSAMERVPSPGEDVWLYLSFARDLLERDRLGAYLPYIESPSGFSRMSLNGWLLEQAMLARVSGLELVDLVLRYLTPTMVVVSLLASYTLGLATFGRRGPTLLASSFVALFLLAYTTDPSLPSSINKFVEAAVQDKFVGRYMLLPVTLTFAVLYARSLELRHLALFAFACVSMVAVHPLELVPVGISVAGFGAVHLTTDWRERSAWIGALGLGAVLLLIVLPPAAYLLATDSALLHSQDSTTPSLDAHRLFQSDTNDRLLFLENGSYMMHPSFMLNPVVLGGYLLGIPFLVRSLKRNPGARLLLGMLLLTPALIFLPPVATLIGGFIAPWMLPRLTSPIFLAALLALGWVAWEALCYAGARLQGLGVRGGTTRFLPLAFVCLLTAAALPLLSVNSRATVNSGETAQDRSTCIDPVFDWMHESFKGSARILAPESENICAPAYVTQATVVSYRGAAILKNSQELERRSGEEIKVPQGALDVDSFFSSPILDAEMVNLLIRNGVNYVLMPTDLPLEGQLEYVPGLTKMDAPGERYSVYAVQAENLGATPAITANSYANQENWSAAIDSYSLALQGNEDERALAYMGLGRANEGLKDFDAAARAYEEAVRQVPEDTAARSLLAGALLREKDFEGARDALEEAVALDPGDVQPHFELGRLLLRMKEEPGAASEYRRIVEMHPRVPEYRVQLGDTLLRTGDADAASREFERAIRLDPLSANLQLRVGRVYERAEYREEAIEYYERARELDPDSPAGKRLEGLRR